MSGYWNFQEFISPKLTWGWQQKNTTILQDLSSHDAARSSTDLQTELQATEVDMRAIESLQPVSYISSKNSLFYKMCATWNLESMWQHSHLGWNSHLFVEWFPYCSVSWLVWSGAMPVCVFTPGTVGRVHKIRPVFSSGWSDRHLYCAVWNLSPCEVIELKQMWSSTADRFSSSHTLV